MSSSIPNSPRTSPVRVSVARTAAGKTTSPTSQLQQMQQVPRDASKTAQVQGQVDEVIGIMQNNIEKVMARGEKLDSLQTKTEELSSGALQFKKNTNSLKNEMWWKDFKLRIIIAVIVVSIIGVGIGLTVGYPKAAPGGSETAANPATPPSAAK
ncbi:synaptobrevin-domain-containing protein [Entophlyctis helioformis]|nr:synaptobrevin-domain-containing protein [Entophlyctis helioformis]